MVACVAVPVHTSVNRVVAFSHKNGIERLLRVYVYVSSPKWHCRLVQTRGRNLPRFRDWKGDRANQPE
jgi:hypothetical protein